MNRQTQPAGKQKQLWLPMLLLAGAVLLLVAALAGSGKEAGQKQITPLNDAVEQALIQLDNKAITEASSDIKLEAEAEQPEMEESVLNGDPPNEQEKESDSRIDINRAGKSELQTLKGIGPSKANAIIMEREKNGFYRSADDLLRVKGIGNKVLSEIKENIVARP